MEFKEIKELLNSLEKKIIKNYENFDFELDIEIYNILLEKFKEFNNKKIEIENIKDEKNGNNILQFILENNKNIFLLKYIIEIYKFFLYENYLNKYLLLFTNENFSNLTIFEQTINLPINFSLHKNLLNYIFSCIENHKFILLQIFSSKRLFTPYHISSKLNQIYPIIFYYEKIYDLFPSVNTLDIPNTYNKTPIHYACYYNNKHLVNILIQYNVDLNAEDINGETPIFYAIKSGNYNLVKKLIVFGANKNKVNKNNENLQKICENYGYKNIKRLFKNKYFCTLNSIKKPPKNNQLLLIFIIIMLFKILFLNKIFILTILLEFFSIFMIIFFNFKGNDFYITDEEIKTFKEKNKNISIIDLIKNENNYDNLEKICINCKIFKKKEMQHCILCNECIEDWDHHCFYLNKCINQNNLKYFILFLISLFFNIIFDFVLIILIMNKKIKLKKLNNYVNFFNFVFIFFSFVLLVCFLGILEQFYIIHYNQKIRNEIIKRESKNKSEKLLENNNNNNDYSKI